MPDLSGSIDRALDLAERWVANEERRENRLAAAQHDSGKRKGATGRQAPSSVDAAKEAVGGLMPSALQRAATQRREQAKIIARREAARAELPAS